MLTPKIRFKEFADNWQAVNLGEVFKERVTTNNPNLQFLSASQTLGVVPSELIDKKIIRTKTDTSDYKLVLVGDFVIGLQAYEGGFEFSKYEGIISPAYKVIYAKIEINQDFYKYFFKQKSFIEQVNKVTPKSTRKGRSVSYKVLSNLPIAIPSLAEQQKIADCLTSIDKIIELQTKKLELLKNHKKALLQKLFPRFDAETQWGGVEPELRFKEFSGDWQVVKLGDVLEVPKKQAVTDPYSIELISVQLHAKGIKLTDKFPQKTEKGRPYYQRFTNEILIGRQNLHNGSIGIVKPEHSGKICSNAISSFLVKKDVLDFVVFYISKESYYLEVANIATGSGQKEISQAKILNLPIAIPAQAEQQKIADCLTSIDAIISKQTAKIETLQTHKKALLQNLLPTIQ